MPPKPMCVKHAVPLMLRRNETTGEVALACPTVTPKNAAAVKMNVGSLKMRWQAIRINRTSRHDQTPTNILPASCQEPRNMRTFCIRLNRFSPLVARGAVAYQRDRRDLQAARLLDPRASQRGCIQVKL